MSSALRTRLERVARMAVGSTAASCAVVATPRAPGAWDDPILHVHASNDDRPDVASWKPPVNGTPTTEATETENASSVRAYRLPDATEDDAPWGALWLFSDASSFAPPAQTVDDLVAMACDAHARFGPAIPNRRVLHAALDHYPFALALFDADLHYLYHNARSAALSGRPQDDVVGLHPREVFSEDVCAPLLPLLEQCRDTLAPVKERVHVPIDGSTRDVIATFTPVLDTNGALDVIIATARDVTPEREARRTLQRERDLLRGIADTSAAAILVIDRDGTTHFVNRRAEELLGVSRERLLHDPPDADWWIITDRDGEPFPVDEQPYFRVLRTGKPVFDVEGTLHRTDGSTVVLSTNAAPILDDDGDVDRIVMLIEDVSERVRREERIREQNDALTTLAQLRTEHTDDWEAFLDQLVYTAATTLDVDRTNVWLLDDDGDTLRCVAAFPDGSDAPDASPTVGATLDLDDHPSYFDALRQSRALLVPDVSDDERVQELADYLDTHDVVALLDAPVRVEGKLTGVVCHEQQAPPDDDADPGRMWTHEDQTFASSIADFVAQAVIAADQKKSQAALRRSEQRWKSLVDHHPGGVVISIDGRFVYANPAAATLVGAEDVDSLIGRSIMNAIGGEDEMMTLMDRKARIERGEPTQPWEHRITGFDGKERIVVVHSVPIIYDGQMAAQTVIRDVTERRRREEELREAKEQALEMNRLKSAFLANMSHEIRTPLTSIIGFSELLSEQDLGEARNIAALIRRSSQRLLQTLNSVLDLSRLEAGSMRLYPEAVNLNDLLRETVELFSQRAEDEGLTLHLDLPDTASRVYLDPSALDRIVTNLLENALKFTESGGRIDVGVRVVDKHVRLWVADTGIGIDPDFLPHVFDAFKQESSGPARSHEGTGLGLAISHRITDLMGGSITVESTKHEGARFTVRLPRVLPSEARGA